MAINWFEGGRRVSQLLMSLPVIGGLIYMATAEDPLVTIATTAPDQAWFVSKKECDYPAASAYPGLQDFGSGVKRRVELCFLANRDGKVAYAEAPAPPDAPPPPLVRTGSSGEAPPEQKWYYFDSPYSSKVLQYTSARSRQFQLTPDLQVEARSLLNLSWFGGRAKSFSDALPWVSGIIFGIWIVTMTIGWIVRGFAGVPTGKDFRE